MSGRNSHLKKTVLLCWLVDRKTTAEADKRFWFRFQSHSHWKSPFKVPRCKNQNSVTTPGDFQNSWRSSLSRSPSELWMTCSCLLCVLWILPLNWPNPLIWTSKHKATINVCLVCCQWRIDSTWDYCPLVLKCSPARNTPTSYHSWTHFWAFCICPKNPDYCPDFYLFWVHKRINGNYTV